MTDVFMERQWPAALTEADMRRLMEIADSCLGIHRVAWVGSMLSADGRDLLCHFAGPDAESVRIAAHEPGMPRGAAWACSVHDAPGVGAAELAGANVAVALRFDGAAGDPTASLEGAARPHLSGRGARWLRLHASLDRRRAIVALQAPDEAGVRQALRDAGLAVDRSWTVRRFAP